jgi:glutaredoxin-dependent peroxiredoxin
VLGISVESDRAHTAFAKALELPFPLLSDFNREIVQRFGIAYGPDEARGGLWGFSRRSVFVLDQTATIRYAWVTDDTANTPDIEEVLGAVAALAQS